MEAEIVISPKGEVTVVINEGNFSDGQEKIQPILELLKAKGFTVEDVKIEQHRHDTVHCCQGVHHHV